MLLRKWRLPRWLHGKESTCQCKRHGSVPGLGRSHVLRETKPTHHRCWVCAPEPGSCDSWSPHALQPALHKRGHCSEAHVLQQGVSPPLPLATAREKAEQRQRPSTAISKWIQLKKEKKRRAVSLVENVPSGYEQEMNRVSVTVLGDVYERKLRFLDDYKHINPACGSGQTRSLRESKKASR